MEKQAEKNCIIAYVFGNAYQSFIPFYGYSILRMKIMLPRVSLKE